MNNIAKKINMNCIEKKLFWGLFLVLFLFIISYIYFVNQTILNIVDRENIEEKIFVLNSEIGEMEFDYIELKNKVTIDYAYSIGFYDVNNVKFASRKLSGQGLSLRGE